LRSVFESPSMGDLARIIEQQLLAAPEIETMEAVKE